MKDWFERFKKKPWATAFMVALAVRLLYLLLVPQREPENDDAFYWSTAQSIAHGEGYVYEGIPATGWMPGLPILLAPVVFVFGPSLFMARLFLVGISVATIPIIHALGREWFDDERIAKGASWVFALYPAFWFFSTAILTETTAIFVMSCGLLALARLRHGFSWKLAVGLGAVWGGLMYVKPEFSFFGPLVFGIAVVFPKLIPRKAAIVAVAVGALMIVPWTARNWSLFHEVIPLKATGGKLVWWVAQEPPVEALNERTPEILAIEETFVVPGKPGATGKNYQKAGIERLKQHPGLYVKRCLTRRLPHLFIGSQCEAATGAGLGKSFGQLRAGGSYGLLGIKLGMFGLQTGISLLGIAGLVLLRDKEKRRFAGRAVFFLMTAVYVALLGIPRYSMVLMPMLVPHGAALLAFAYEWWKARAKGTARDSTPEAETEAESVTPS